MVSYFPLISAIISVAFTILLAVQYVRRRRMHQFLWTISLMLFTLTSLLAFLSEASGWNVFTYQIYYVSLSPMVAFMGTGTLYLTTHKPYGTYFLVYTLILSTLFAGLVFTAPVDATLLGQASPPSEIGSAAMPSNVRLVSPLLSVPGGLVLIGGAFYSFWLDRNRKYVLLIAAGGIMHMVSGLRARFGEDPTFFFTFTTIGVLLLFLGFLLNSEYIRKRDSG